MAAHPIVQSMTGAEYAEYDQTRRRRRFQLQPLTLSSCWFMNPRQDQQHNHFNNLSIQPLPTNYSHEEEEEEYNDISIPTEEDLRRYDLIDEELTADQYTTLDDNGLQLQSNKEAIAKRLNYNATNSNSHIDDDTICVVCQDRLFQKESGKKIVGLDCGHHFHAGCIESWLLIKNRCPLCNATGICL